jgi:hypothetical protein
MLETTSRVDPEESQGLKEKEPSSYKFEQSG